MLKKNRGFTLIEILIVVIIIGILAMIALPLYRAQIEKAHLAEAEENLSRFKQAAGMYYATKGNFDGITFGKTGLKSFIDMGQGDNDETSTTIGDFKYMIQKLYPVTPAVTQKGKTPGATRSVATGCQIKVEYVGSGDYKGELPEETLGSGKGILATAAKASPGTPPDPAAILATAAKASPGTPPDPAVILATPKRTIKA